MEILTEKVGNVLKISIKGRLVVSTTEQLKTVLGKAVTEERLILLDLSEMSYIDSSGLGVIVFAQQKLAENGGTLRLACLQPKPRIVFDVSKIYRIFDIFDTVDMALESFSK